jgi:hypothetical protein
MKYCEPVLTVFHSVWRDWYFSALHFRQQYQDDSCEKLWDAENITAIECIFYGFTCFRHNAYLPVKFSFQIQNDLYKLTPFGTWYPDRTMSLTDSLWFPIAIADILQRNNENPIFDWELFCSSYNATSSFKLYRTHIFIRHPYKHSIVLPVVFRTNYWFLIKL